MIKRWKKAKEARLKADREYYERVARAFAFLLDEKRAK